MSKETVSNKIEEVKDEATEVVENVQEEVKEVVEEQPETKADVVEQKETIFKKGEKIVRKYRPVFKKALITTGLIILGGLAYGYVKKSNTEEDVVEGEFEGISYDNE